MVLGTVCVAVRTVYTCQRIITQPAEEAIVATLKGSQVRTGKEAAVVGGVIHCFLLMHYHQACLLSPMALAAMGPVSAWQRQQLW